MIRRAGLLALAALALAPFAMPAAGQEAVPPPEGAAIFASGAAAFASGAGLEARIGSPTGPIVPAARLTCAGCHGVDGRGGREGGPSAAPAIVWPFLAQPTATRPAYDAATFGRLLTKGVAPDGRVISPRMPRFRADPATLAALVAYLETLDAAETSGLGPDTVAVRLPADSAAAEAARDAIAVFNAEGGAYGRRVVVADPAFLDLVQASALLAPRLAEAEAARLALLAVDEPDAKVGPVSALGARLPALLAAGNRVVMVGPDPVALRWALDELQNAEAAAAHARTTAALALLREAGRHPTRSRLIKALASADLTEAVTVYRYEPGAD